MNRPLEPVGSSVNHPRLRMDTGLDVLDRWADHAGNDDKNAVYAALFAMTDRTVLRSTYEIVEDEHELSEFSILLPGNLVLKMRVHSFDSFGVVYVGPGLAA